MLFSALWACPAQTLLGADPAFVGVLALAVDAEVSKKLALTDEVKGQLTALIEKRETEALELALSVKELPAEEKAAKLAAFVADSEKEGFKLLTNSQKARLEEARVLKAGMSVLAESKIAKALEFTDEQKAEVAKLLAERTAEMAKASGDEERQKTAANYERNLQALLSKEQRAVWERLAGLNAPEQTAEAETPKTEPKTDPRTGRPPVGPVRGTDPRGGKPEAKPSLPGASKDGKVQFSFKYAPWKDVIEWFASTADLSLVGDVFPQGTFNYTDTKRYTPDEALDILNSVLLTKGYTLVRRERMLLLVDVENNKIPEVLISIIPVEELDTRGKYEMVKVLFTLKKMTLEEAERDVRKMLGPQGALVALPTAKQILVTESAGTLRVIRSMINAVENPEVSRDDQFVEVKLSKVSPDEALMMVRPLMGILDGQNRLSDGSLSIAVDQLGFRLIVSGRPEKITRLQEIIKMVDVGNNIVGTSGTVIEQAQIEVYLVTSADLETVKAVFTTMLAGQSDARLSVDPKTNSIIVMAKPTQHRGLAATLAQLQGASNNPKVIQLRMLDPTGTQLLIKNMFGTDASAPKVEVDVATRKLIIRGTLSQYEQIKSMLKDLGEDDAKIAQSNEQRGNVRLIPLPTSSSATRDALDQIDSIWPTIRSNPVTVRNLSAKDRDSSLRTRGAPAESKAAPRASEEPEGRPALKYDPTRPAARRPEANRTLPVGPGSQRPRIIYTSDSSYISHLDDAPESKAPEAKTPETKAPETPATQEPKAKEPVAKEPVTKEPVAQEPVDKAPVAKKPEVKQEPKPSETTEPADVPTEPKNPEAPKKVSVKGAEIVVSIGPGGILIASDDTEALNDFEELLRRIITVPTQPGANFTVFYLKYAKADLASELLMEIIGGAPADTGGGGSLLGDMLGGGNLFGSLLGLGGGGAAATTPIKTSGQVSVVPDTRLNALVVQGNAADLALVEKLLETIDQESSPEPPELNGKPRMIMLENIPATEAASVVQSVFASRIAGSAAGGGQNRQPSPQEFMQALRGGGGNNRRTQRTERSEPKMTLGVDARSNALIVSAPEPLFMEVKLLCEQLDHAGEDSSSSETTRVVTLKRTNPEVVQRALTSITGGTVKSNTTQTPLTQTQLAGGQGQRGAQGQRGTQGGQQPQMDINTLIRGLQGGGNRGGAQGGGNRGGTQGGGSRGGTQGGGSRSGTQGGGSRGGSQGGGRGGFQ